MPEITAWLTASGYKEAASATHRPGALSLATSHKDHTKTKVTWTKDANFLEKHGAFSMTQAMLLHCDPRGASRGKQKLAL